MRFKKLLVGALAFVMTFAVTATPLCDVLPETTGESAMSVGAMVYDYNDYSYWLLNGTVEIYKYHGNAAELEIPSEIDGITVTSIGVNAFSHCSSLKSVTIPGNVTNIGYEAFSYCESLASVIMCDGVTVIGYNAFIGCTSLKNVTIPDSVTSISNGAFAGTAILLEQTAQIRYIGKWVILGNMHNMDFKAAEIKDGTVGIADGAFRYHHYLESVAIPDSVKNIGKYAFDDSFFIRDVYYSGTQSQWNEIDIKEGNDCLLNADIHYSSAPDYTVSSNVTVTENKYDGTILILVFVLITLLVAAVAIIVILTLRTKRRNK